MERTEELNTILLPFAEEYGYDILKVSFMKYKEFKVSWIISGKIIEFKLPDYLDDAPNDIIIDFLKTMLDYIRDKNFVYSDAYQTWVTSDEFIIKNRKIYLRRSKNVRRTSMGTYKDLANSLDRLLDSGLLTPEDIDNSYFTWTSRDNFRKMGCCSPMMRVVEISSVLDKEDTPDFVIDYVTYHESLHLRQGYKPHRRSHDIGFKRLERLFPDWKESEKYLTDIYKKS